MDLARRHVLASDGTGAGEERGMNKVTDVSEPASELERLIADLSGSGPQMRPEKLEAWRALRERYGNRDESRVDRGTLMAPAA
jgi:hypothetical protein